jgi:hypothetical protein
MWGALSDERMGLSFTICYDTDHFLPTMHLQYTAIIINCHTASSFIHIWGAVLGLSMSISSNNMLYDLIPLQLDFVKHFESFNTEMN